MLHDLRADAFLLEFWQQDNVEDSCIGHAIGNSATSADELASIPDKASHRTIGECVP